MSLTVKAGYTNPLTMMGQKKHGLNPTPQSAQKNDEEKNLHNLQTRQQTLQNQLLLMKSTSNGALASKDSQEVLEQQLEETQAELKTAKAQVTGSVNGEEQDKTGGNVKRNLPDYDRVEISHRSGLANTQDLAANGIEEAYYCKDAREI